jgi:D-alanine transaminase
VDANGVLVTRGLTTAILGGITRAAVLDACVKNGLEVVQRAFTPEDAKTGLEAMITSTTSLVVPVVEIDGDSVGNGRPGPIFHQIRELYLTHIQQS